MHRGFINLFSKFTPNPHEHPQKRIQRNHVDGDIWLELDRQKQKKRKMWLSVLIDSAKSGKSAYDP
jgi:hypothetical protein